jgi:hypothetical protein
VRQLDLTGELPGARPFRELPDSLILSVLDLTAPTTEQLGHAVGFIDRKVRAGRVVCVHCKAGAARGEAADSALRRSRECVIIRREALAVLSAA